MLTISMMNFFNRMLLNQKHISGENDIRLLASVYAIILMIVIKLIDHTNEYDGLICAYSGLIIGRFTFFDSSIKQIFEDLRRIFQTNFLIIISMSILMIFVVVVYMNNKIDTEKYDMMVQFLFMHGAMIIGIYFCQFKLKL